MQSGSKPSLPFKYLEDITNNFAEERILGKGSFGIVYKGLLDNGEMVAVKKLSETTPSSLGQLENELILLKKLEHKNIVRLVGHCYETEPTPACQKGNFFLLRTLKFCFAWNICRMEVLTNTLKYLHEHSNEPIIHVDEPIIHVDLKPANILLDVNMLPKITDFGLSRLFDQNKTIFTASAGGTIGYMPPEYTRGKITPMWDIFSLGVIIMEVITGHRKYPDDLTKDYEGFIELELQIWRNRLQKEPGFTSHEKDFQLIERCIQIGLICMNPNRKKRPTIKKVIDMLEGTESMNVYIRNEAEHALNEQDHGMPNSPGETSSKLVQKDLVFTVKNEQGYELKQLRDLNNLHRSLKICGLGNVTSREEALEANLAGKERLTELELEWANSITKCSTEVELQVLEGLCPPKGLKKLNITWYQRSTYPDWMVGKTNGGPKDLQELCLLTFVKGPAPQIVEAFPHLRVLWLAGGDWEALPSNMEHLTSLKSLKIELNRNIQSLPTLPRSLDEFGIFACGDKFMKSCQTFGDPNWLKLMHIREKTFDGLSIVDRKEVKLKSFWRRMTT